MNKTITMYELLGLIKEGKADDITTEFMFDRKKYNLLTFLNEYTLDINSLNWEVEILEEEPRDIEVCGSWFTKSEYDKLAHSEEEKKIPEKLPYYSLEKIQEAKNKDEWREERISLLEKRVSDYHIKINEIIDYLKSKGDE